MVGKLSPLKIKKEKTPAKEILKRLINLEMKATLMMMQHDYFEFA